MAGRTHCQHAVPITFGLKAATWADELARCRGAARPGGRDRLDRAARRRRRDARHARGERGSRAGGLQPAAWPRPRRRPLARDARPAARPRARALARSPRPPSASRRRSSGCSRPRSRRSREPSTDAHVGSSTMPQKRNPMTCEYVVASARLLRGPGGRAARLAGARLRAGHGLLGGRVGRASRRRSILAAGVVDKLAAVLEGLEVDAERMRANLDVTPGPDHGRGRDDGARRGRSATSARTSSSSRASRRAAAEGRRPAARSSPRSRKWRLGSPAAELDELLDPTSYLGLADASAGAVTRSTEGTPMKITAVEPIVLRLPDVDTSRADGTQDAFLVRIHTDEGIVGDRRSGHLSVPGADDRRDALLARDCPRAAASCSSARIPSRSGASGSGSTTAPPTTAARPSRSTC